MKTRAQRRSSLSRRRLLGQRNQRSKSQFVRRLLVERCEDRRVMAVDFSGSVSWDEQGPGPITDGQVEGLGAQNNPVAGAVEAIAPHPTNADILFAGTVNGGIWRTTNATAASPTWEPLTDQFPSLSTAAIAYSPLDATNNTLFVATGDWRSGSSVVGGQAGNGAIGILRTTDGGDTWSILAAAQFAGNRLRSIVPTALTDAGTGQQIVLVAADDGNGVWRSIDGGNSFTQISGTLATSDGVDNDADGATDEAGELNLPNGSATHLTRDPGNTSRFYASIPSSGVHRTDDGGVSWRRVNGTGVNTIGFLPAQRVEVSVSAAAGNAAFVQVINGGQLSGLFRSTDQGANWIQLDTPQTTEGGVGFGLQPREKSGAQGRIHASILADATSGNVVFLGGDRQPRPGPDGIEGNGDDAFPNSIGANDFSGRLFRVDASLAAGTQAAPVTNNGANGTSPHADSRDMLFDANGNILESDDGGIYRLLNPNNPATRRWVSVNGNLRITEFYGVAYDSLNDVVIGGTQDVGSPEQDNPGGFSWDEDQAGDGFIAEAGVVGPLAVRYITSQNLGTFSRKVYDNANNLIISSPIALNVNGTGGGTTSLRLIGGLGFLQPYAINVLNPVRMVIGTNFLFESNDGGDNLTALGGQTGIDNVNNDGDGQTDEADEVTLQNPVGPVQAFAYGGRSGGVDMPDVLYVGTTGGTVNGNFGRLFLRTANTTNTLADFTMLTTYPGNAVADIAIDSDDFTRAYILDTTGRVWRTTDAGATAAGWTELTGNLSTSSFISQLTTIAFVAGGTGDSDVLTVGGLGGVARTLLDTTSAGTWLEVGGNLPNVRAFDLRYNAADDVLLAGTIGRGAWIADNASLVLQDTPVLTVCGDEDFVNQDDIIRLVRNPGNPALLQVFINNSTLIPDFEAPIGAIAQINVFGVGGNDNLIVESTSGLIDVLLGIRYNGDGKCPTIPDVRTTEPATTAGSTA